jgi:CSLREA domain-containing protein
MLLSGVLVYGRVQASTITVNTTDDDIDINGNCTLREAIRAANLDTAVDACPAGSGADTIILPAGDYVLTLPGIDENAAAQGDLDISFDLKIEGAGRHNTTINANGIDRVFHILSGEVEISKVTITGGSIDNDAGGIGIQGGNVLLIDSRVVDNETDLNYGYGGGITVLLEETTLTLVRTVVANNRAAYGGGIANVIGTVTLIDSLVRDNSAEVDGGGIYNLSADLFLVNSTISGNSAGQFGGGIHFLIDIDTQLNGVTQLFNVTISNNSAFSGGGVYLESGIEEFRLQNSIIAGNFDNGGGAPDCRGTLTSEGYNFIQSVTNCPIIGDITGNVTGVAPFLSPLANNGGPTMTHAFFLSSSLAVDGGNPTGCTGQIGEILGTDQRGFVRPIDGNGDGQNRCDMGAYEFNSPGVPTPTPTPTNTPAPPPTATPDPPHGDDEIIYLPFVTKP